MTEGLAPLVTYCVLMSATPGPNNVMLATSGANFGYLRTVPHLLGVSAGVFALTMLACLGLGAVFTQLPAIHGVLKIVGSLYLVYLAWKLAGASVSQNSAGARPLSFLEGAAFQVVNPKSWMRAATVATVFMPAGAPPAQAALLVSTVGWAVGLPCISIWTLFGVAIRRFLDSRRRLQVFNGAMGLSLLALAIALML